MARDIRTTPSDKLIIRLGTNQHCSRIFIRTSTRGLQNIVTLSILQPRKEKPATTALSATDRNVMIKVWRNCNLMKLATSGDRPAYKLKATRWSFLNLQLNKEVERETSAAAFPAAIEETPYGAPSASYHASFSLPLIDDPNYEGPNPLLRDSLSNVLVNVPNTKQLLIIGEEHLNIAVTYNELFKCVYNPSIHALMFTYDEAHSHARSSHIDEDDVGIEVCEPDYFVCSVEEEVYMASFISTVLERPVIALLTLHNQVLDRRKVLESLLPRERYLIVDDEAWRYCRGMQRADPRFMGFGWLPVACMSELRGIFKKVDLSCTTLSTIDSDLKRKLDYPHQKTSSASLLLLCIENEVPTSLLATSDRSIAALITTLMQPFQQRGVLVDGHEIDGRIRTRVQASVPEDLPVHQADEGIIANFSLGRQKRRAHAGLFRIQKSNSWAELRFRIVRGLQNLTAYAFLGGLAAQTRSKQFVMERVGKVEGKCPACYWGF
ncbi:uncharacterized protein BDR25DRAFT_351686 [Lindgomyces ingoldianus]|uniref:Uncharacterized protein n=1 Tax=Lindgomyces ingoldianus TaxID=673940 RepID=A0ACB6R762_9PLEO|nr:uncharacterized protein BDR25DRAFT_351686 [Lindgomyces ingoldianus]KAF2474157.1 hypothetical protein BDR25DRAFT_351686 [Lindgomyces ingoldianus]